MPVVRLSAALTTLIALVLDIDYTYTNRSLKVPVTRKHPLITIGSTTAYIPAFVTMVTQFLVHTKRQFDICRIKLTTQSVDTDKRTLEAMAEPITILWHQQPMLEILLPIVSVKLPGVQSIEQLHGVFLTYSQFHT
jgi:hypothetical protein